MSAFPPLPVLLDRVASHEPQLVTPGPGQWQASLALILHEPTPGVTEALLIERTIRPDDPWSGHMALPGGRVEPGDEDLEATARREAREEVGVVLPPALGRLDDGPSVTRSEVLVAPHVFALPERPLLQLQASEVASAVWIPLPHFLDPAAATTVPYRRPGGVRHYPGIRHGRHVVWGITYRVLRHLFEVLGRPMPPPPVPDDHASR
jgi:8-oxo-dGTP pyrophosphatase MutT (NUDIX family)